MKKIIVIILIGGVLGGSVYWGYLAQQRKKINTWLEEDLLGYCDPTPRKDRTASENWLKKQSCMLVEEENEELRKLAKESKTYKEFKTKVEIHTETWLKEDKMGKLAQEYKKRKK